MIDMKRIMILMLCLVALTTGAQSVFAQKVNVETDKFTKERIIETSFEKIAKDGTFDSRFVNYMKNVWVAFRKVGDTEYLRIKWCSKDVVAIDKDAEIILLDKNGNAYTFKNTEYIISGKGEGTVGSWGSALLGVDIYATGNCAELADKEFTDLRITTTNGYFDFEIMKKAAKTISELYNLVVKAQE